MKLTKPINQRKNILQRAISWNGYRFLSIFMAALLFCGMNSQVMAASLPPGANYAAAVSAPAASGDQFNAASFMEESNPTADADQHWTLMGKIGAVIAGTAVIVGAAAGGRFYEARQVRIAEEGGNAAASADHQRDATDPVDSSNASIIERKSDGTAADKTIAAGSGWSGKVSDSVTAFGAAAYDLVTLKSCLPASAAKAEVEAKPFMDQLAVAHDAQVKKKQADARAERTWGQFAYNLFTLKNDVAPDHRTARQKEVEELQPLLRMKQGDLKVTEVRKLNAHLDNEEARKEAIEALTPASSLEAIKAALDPEIVDPLAEPLKKYSTDQNGVVSDEAAKKLAYFVAKNQDTFKLHLGHLDALKTAFEDAEQEGSSTKEASQALVQKLHEEIQAQWEKDRGEVEDSI